MNQPVPFDLAVSEDRAFRFEHGPGTSPYLAPDPGAPGQARVVTLPDGRVVEQLPLSMLESVFSLQTFRLSEEGPAPIAVDSITGLVGEPGDSVVQIRVMPPNPGAEMGIELPGDDLIAAGRMSGWRRIVSSRVPLATAASRGALICGIGSGHAAR